VKKQLILKYALNFLYENSGLSSVLKIPIIIFGFRGARVVIAQQESMLKCVHKCIAFVFVLKHAE
jgi:hypothetical protein